MQIGKKDKIDWVIFIDSCAFYPPQQDEKKATEKLFELDEQDVIHLEIAEATEEELQKAPAKLRDRILSRICSREIIGSTEEMKKLLKIKQLLFPNKVRLSENEEKDTRNMFVANKYGCDFFVTFDKKHFLNKAHLIKQDLQMNVVTPLKCLKTVLNEITPYSYKQDNLNDT